MTFTHDQLKCYASMSPACTAALADGTPLPPLASVTWDNEGAGSKANALDAAKVRIATWFQPKAKSDYAKSLRRYSAGDKVRGYNLQIKGDSARPDILKNSDFISGNIIKLVNAVSLAAGAVALGAATTLAI